MWMCCAFEYIFVYTPRSGIRNPSIPMKSSSYDTMNVYIICCNIAFAFLLHDANCVSTAKQGNFWNFSSFFSPLLTAHPQSGRIRQLDRENEAPITMSVFEKQVLWPPDLAVTTLTSRRNDENSGEADSSRVATVVWSWFCEQNDRKLLGAGLVVRWQYVICPLVMVLPSCSEIVRKVKVWRWKYSLIFRAKPV